MSHVIGIDLGGSKIALGLVNPRDEIIARRRIDTESEAGLGSVIERIAVEIEALKASLQAGRRVDAVGIGAPGPVDHVSGDLLTLVNLPGISNSPFRRALQERISLPVALDHDAKVAALGEFHFGAGSGRESMIYIVIGTGVGAAIIYQGRLMYGESNSAGESGHMTVDPNGHRCHCGSRGCLETYTSGPALAKHYTAATGEAISGAEVGDRALAGDEIARALLRAAGRALGIAIASLAMTLNIELFVIGGGVVQAGDLLLETARASLKDYSFPAVSARIQVRASTIGEDAPILGAAWLARQRLIGAVSDRACEFSRPDGLSL
ncbi:MAG: ROK family protein [Chloroflexi bacterium]|nr:ROK family protein [Chloroflexota bacterium]